MQIVIDIPEEVLNRICFGVTYPTDMVVVCNAIHEHIKLPKGHGRLIDGDAVEKFGTERMWQVSIGACNMFDVVMHNAPTIIEADKEVDDVRKSD